MPCGTRATAGTEALVPTYDSHSHAHTRPELPGACCGASFARTVNWQAGAQQERDVQSQEDF